MKSLDAPCVAAAVVVTVAAICGGAFFPGPRIFVGIGFATVMAGAVFVVRDRFSGEEWALVGFIGWSILASVMINNSLLVSREVVTTWVVALILWMTARRAPDHGSNIALRVLIGAALVLVLGVALEAFGMGGIRVGGLLENPNLTASLIVLSLPTVFALKGNVNRGWRLSAAAALVGGVVLTGSRAGLLAVLAASSVMLPRGRWRGFGLSAGTAGIVAVLAWRFLSQPDILAWFRPAIWQAVLRVWAAHPIFGVGPGGLVDAAGTVRILHADHVGQRQFLVAYSESTPLAILVQTGLIGFGILAAALFMWLRRARANGTLSGTPVRAAMISMIVMAAFHDFLTADIVLWWWAMTAGLLEAECFRRQARAEERSSWRPPRVAMAFILGYVVLWGMVGPAWARWMWRSEGPDATLVDRVYRAETWDPTPLGWRADVLTSGDAWDWEVAAEALSRSRTAVGLHPGSASRWGVLALTNARVVTELGPWPDSVSEAREAFARAVALEPHQPWYWLEWARFERTLGDVDRAANLVRRAVDEEPHAVRAWLFLARLELDRGQLENAREALGRAEASDRLRTRRGLNGYERELIAAPRWQFRELQEALR